MHARIGYRRVRKAMRETVHRRAADEPGRLGLASHVNPSSPTFRDGPPGAPLSLPEGGDGGISLARETTDGVIWLVTTATSTKP